MRGETGVRRVVTGHDDTGKAIVLFDSIDPHASPSGTGNERRMLWATPCAPAPIDGANDRALEQRTFSPNAGGSIFRIIDFPSMTDAEMAAVGGGVFAERTAHAGGPSVYRPPTHPFMHRTRTVDYAIVLEGEIEMKLDDDVVALKAGDVVVQQGTNHAWINRSGALCRIAFVLIDATDPFGA